jgi:hypothetical protein
LSVRFDQSNQFNKKLTDPFAFAFAFPFQLGMVHQKSLWGHPLIPESFGMMFIPFSFLSFEFKS